METALKEYSIDYERKTTYFKADAQNMPALLQVIGEQKDLITDLEIKKGTFNDVFLEITGRKIREEA